MIQHCTCAHPFQDHAYGPQMRVFNPRGAKHKGQARCTVCSAERTIVNGDSGADKPDAKAARKAAEKAAKRERKAASAERR